MTFSDELIDGNELEEEYPSAFGITFSPIVTGIALAVFGLVGAAYIYNSMVAPAQKKYKTVETQKQQKQAQLNQMKRSDYGERVVELQKKLNDRKKVESQVISMFTNQDDLETLLIDLNNFISAKNVKLLKYSPSNQISTVTDNSLGSGAQGKVKRTSISIEIEGTFAQTKSVLRDLERLQPLLMITQYDSKVSEKSTAVLDGSFRAIQPNKSAILTTELDMDAILPISQQELEKAREAEKNSKKKDSKKK